MLDKKALTATNNINISNLRKSIYLIITTS